MSKERARTTSHGRDREVDVTVHVVDVEADIFKRHPRSFVAGGDAADVLLRLVAPAALPEAERPERRQIAPADSGKELPRDVVRALPFDEIDGNALLG